MDVGAVGHGRKHNIEDTLDHDVSNLTVSELIRVNSGGTAIESSGKTVPTGAIVGTTDTQTLTNKTIDADNNTVNNLAHGAEVDNPTSGVHGATGSIVGTSDTQTLTNKTLTTPTISTPDIDGGTIDGASLGTNTKLTDLVVDQSGLDVDPTGDADANLITVGVSGTPLIIWDESLNSFAFSHGISISSGYHRIVFASVTISGGSITPTCSYMVVDTQGSASTDDLDTIVIPASGVILIVQAANAARTVVMKDGTGNMRLAGDFSLDHTQDKIVLMVDAGGTVWHELSRSNNG